MLARNVAIRLVVTIMLLLAAGCASRGNYAPVRTHYRDIPNAQKYYSVQKGDTLYYAFYADAFDGQLELRGLKDRNYRLNDYVNNVDMGSASASANKVNSSFKQFQFIEAVPE